MFHLRTERHQPDYILMIVVLMLTGIGVITVFTASTVYDLQHDTSAAHMAIRQLAFGLFGLVVFGVITYVPYHTWFKHAPKLLLIATGLLIIVLVPGVGHSSNGATRWLGASSIHLQPSAVAIIVAVIYLSFLLTKKMTVLHNSRRAFRPAIMVVLMLTGLVFIEPDMGTSMALFGTAIVLMFASGLRMRPIIVTLGVLAPVGYLLIRLASYRSSRLDAFFHPFDPNVQSTSGYQLIQGLTAIANGGLTGRGFDNSIMATGYLPEAYTDFIFSVFTEQWGWLGDAGLLAIFAVLVWRGFRIARYARDRFGALLAIGLTSTIIIQAAINLAAVTWLLPVTGIPLPFISYGGTAIVLNLFAMGILMSVSRETLETATDVDSLAEIVSVDEFRADRGEQLPRLGQQRDRKQRPAQVTALSSRRSSPWQSSVGSTSRQKASQEPVRRNISLTWKAQQESAASRQGRSGQRDRDGNKGSRKNKR
ncbi:MULTISPECIES: FtsW/RodA/SpoVE family cell cycle protein [Alicyclobacillus]|uniref:Probable peptidoglycan glycosyltransferase FtsW n=1 Tax=Alicyclobacillus acidoterrestris (strain ATCC 49025 / DSM 3922 / CIP 106132 / NCIMB 13137 / GD3B) TaxID=1356854 RepID=A0A9E6ZJC4_ALIAG|nr:MULTISPECIES: putative peptidoglycan glycosyltransferase FtsW [Alicyclobacillus]UNO50807.1 putative lipid II flippase FtsW [Alicyclobacillus acidoterrestris]